MEDALRAIRENETNRTVRVLILILMEDALRVEEAEKWIKFRSTES